MQPSQRSSSSSGHRGRPSTSTSTPHSSSTGDVRMIRSSSNPGRGRGSAPGSTTHSPSLPLRSGSPHSQLSPRSPQMAFASPPSYVRSSLDRSPSAHPLLLDDRPRVPPPIYLRSSSPQKASTKGSLKIHVPAWGVALVKPPRQLDLHPFEQGSTDREPPKDDTVLTGALEVIMKERRRCQAISVGVQSVCRLNMGAKRGWEEDGVFERGVEVLSGDSEGIWLEKGSQSFKFSILLPATLATLDYHTFGRISYILTARVEGIPDSSSFVSIFKGKDSVPSVQYTDIPFASDFVSVISRSDKMARELAKSPTSGTSPLSRTGSRSSISNAHGQADLSPRMGALGLSGTPSTYPDDSAIAIADGGSPSLMGLYHRRQSNDMSAIPPISLNPDSSSQSPRNADDNRSIASKQSIDGAKSEKNGWLKGDLFAVRSLLVHANPSPTGGVNILELRKEGFVDGLGSWRFTASSDVFCISAVLLMAFNIPSPSPDCTIFFTRLIVTQTYTLTSPRTPNDTPHQPEAIKNHVLYQIGTPHKSGVKHPDHSVDALWRGVKAGGTQDVGSEGWKTKAVCRLPSHEKIRPSTNPGTITPIRVKHELVLQVFYSIEGRSVSGQAIDGPGELRAMGVKMPIIIPTCCCTTSALDLPTYEDCGDAQADIDAILNSPPTSKKCMCGFTFAELGEAAMRRMQQQEQQEEAESGREPDLAPGQRAKELDERRGSMSVSR